MVQRLLDFTIGTYYPEVTVRCINNAKRPQIQAAHADAEDRYCAFFQEVAMRTARLAARWQCVGFCHGSHLPALRNRDARQVC